MNIEIREVGEKLRKLRKQLNLKQDDLVKHCPKSADKEKPFTRNLVSMVETGKAPLTKKMAETIHSNIISACKSKGISYNFDFNEICKTPENQIIEHIINFERNIAYNISIEESIKYAEELIKLARRYNLLEPLANLYYLMGDLTSSSSHTLSLKYYTAAYTLLNYIAPQNRFKLIRNLKKTYILLEQYNDALNLSYDDYDSSEEPYLHCLYNDVLALKKLSRNEEALLKITKLKTLFASRNDNLCIRLKMLEANIYYAIGDYKKFININESILKITKDPDLHILVLKNLINHKTDLGISSIKEIDNLASIELPNCLSQVNKTEILLGISQCYESFDEDKSFIYLTKALESMVSNTSLTPKNKKYFNDTINLIFNDSNRVEKLINGYYENFKLLMHTAIDKEFLDQTTLLKMIHYFISNNESDFVKKLIERKIS